MLKDKSKKEVQSKVLDVLSNCLTWIQEHINDEEELKRVLREHIGIEDEDFELFGFHFEN